MRVRKPLTARQQQKAREASRRWRERNPEKAKKRNHPQFAKRQALRDLKEVRGCSRCPETDGRCLAFHHRDPATKKFTIGANVNRYTWEELLIEVAKCDVVCCNCHAKEHIPEY